MKRLAKISGALLTVVVLFGHTTGVMALSQADFDSITTDTPWYDTSSSGCVASPTQAGGVTNQDYAGNPILTQGQLEAIAANQPTYEQAAKQVGIPWQMLAVIHLNETGLKLNNPNDDGLFQYVSKSYPRGPVSQPLFLQMAIDAANLIKSSGPAGLTVSTTDAAIIKQTFFAYNGQASPYVIQAKALGFTAAQGYEGSPYVMNKADARRDPNVNKTTWGQIKHDHGGIEYPANNFYGTFVTYGALAGIAPDGSSSCGGISGEVEQKIVQIAQQELALWTSGQLVPGSGFNKYSQGRAEDWCADFSSWVYNQAGAPLATTKEGNVPAVIGVKDAGIRNNHYHYKAVYTPKPGDIVVRSPETEHGHVNIVISVTGDKMVVIGGNQGGTGTFSKNRVSQYTDTLSNSEIDGYVSPR